MIFYVPELDEIFVIELANFNVVFGDGKMFTDITHKWIFRTDSTLDKSALDNYSIYFVGDL